MKSDIERVELLPCPFCGRRPNHTSRAATEGENSPSKEMNFISCMCGGYSARAHQSGYTFAEVRDKWNTRAQQNQASGAVDVEQNLIRRVGQAIYDADKRGVLSFVESERMAQAAIAALQHPQAQQSDHSELIRRAEGWLVDFNGGQPDMDYAAEQLIRDLLSAVKGK